MSEQAVHEGGCGCGHVRYRVTGEPIFVNNCHCLNCQRQTGSTSVVNAFFEAERVELLQGELIDFGVSAGSGGPHVIRRCAQCGSALWSAYPRLGDLGLGVRVGTLDDAGAFVPDAIVFTRSRMAWVALPEGIPSFEQSYVFADVLPPARLERLMALAERRKAGEG